MVYTGSMMRAGTSCPERLVPAGGLLEPEHVLRMRQGVPQVSRPRREIGMGRHAPGAPGSPTLRSGISAQIHSQQVTNLQVSVTSQSEIHHLEPSQVERIRQLLD
jgi:hypothetical protein